MYTDPVNPIIKQTLSEFLQKDLEYEERAFDADDVIYSIVGDPDNQRVLYGFKCNAAEQIMANGGAEMLEAEYAAHALPRDQWMPDFSVTLQISTADFPKTQKVKKSMPEAQQEEIRAANE